MENFVINVPVVNGVPLVRIVLVLMVFVMRDSPELEPVLVLVTGMALTVTPVLLDGLVLAVMLVLLIIMVLPVPIVPVPLTLPVTQPLMEMVHVLVTLDSMVPIVTAVLLDALEPLALPVLV